MLRMDIGLYQGILLRTLFKSIGTRYHSWFFGLPEIYTVSDICTHIHDMYTGMYASYNKNEETFLSIYIYIYIHIYIHIYMYICTHIYIYTHMYTYIYIEAHTNLCGCGSIWYVAPSVVC